MLRDDGYYLNVDQLLLNSLTRACQLIKDQVKTHLPIGIKLLELLLFELGRIYHDQIYLLKLYRALFSLAYYGMFRVGELGQSEHSIKAADIHLGLNKHKILVVLHSSKTHGEESHPQKVKITEAPGTHELSRHFCPFTLVNQFMIMRGDFVDTNEQLFMFQGNLPVQPQHIHNVLNKACKLCN